VTEPVVAVGVPPLDGALLYGDPLDLVGSAATTAWFRVDPAAHRAFMGACFLDQVYDALDDDTVVEGFYLLSLVDPLVSGLFRRSERQDDVLNYGVEHVRFPSTVREADLLRLHCAVPTVTVRPSGGRVVRYECTLEVDGRDAPGMVATWLLHVPPPSAPAHPSPRS
jgi:acyl dehydratase